LDKKTVNKTRSVSQAEMEEIVENVSRLEKPYAKFVDFEFKLDSFPPYTLSNNQLKIRV